MLSSDLQDTVFEMGNAGQGRDRGHHEQPDIGQVGGLRESGEDSYDWDGGDERSTFDVAAAECGGKVRRSGGVEVVADVGGVNSVEKKEGKGERMASTNEEGGSWLCEGVARRWRACTRTSSALKWTVDNGPFALSRRRHRYTSCMRRKLAPR